MPLLERIAATSVILALPALAVADDATWLKDANGCQFLKPDGAPSNVTIEWDGQCVDGYVAGQGTIKVDGVSFKGEFTQGRLPNGEINAPDGTSYVGDLQDNNPRGQGRLNKPSGEAVQGTFNSLKETTGIVEITSTDGGVYVGEVTGLDTLHGKGKVNFPDGYVYEGEFKNNKYHGQGKQIDPAGWSYTGEFAFGKYQGRGVLVSAQGDTYEGNFAAGYKQGKGTLTYGNGDRYIGDFVADQFQGKGRYEFAGGAAQDGEWKANRLQGTCTILFALKMKYTGQCVAGEMSGEGDYQDPTSGMSYHGNFLAGKFHGHGRMQKPGYVYEGEFAGGNRSGKGKEVLENGEQYEGMFARDQREGKGVLRGVGLDGSEILYEGDFKLGAMHGVGKMRIGAASFDGEFKQGVFSKGRVRAKDGRVLEVDVQQDSVMEVRSDGTKVPVTPDQLLDPEA